MGKRLIVKIGDHEGNATFFEKMYGITSQSVKKIRDKEDLTWAEAVVEIARRRYEKSIRKGEALKQEPMETYTVVYPEHYNSGVMYVKRAVDKWEYQRLVKRYKDSVRVIY